MLPLELYQVLPGMSRAAIAQHAQEFLQHALLAGSRQVGVYFWPPYIFQFIQQRSIVDLTAPTPNTITK